MKTIDRLSELLKNCVGHDKQFRLVMAQYLIDNGVIFKDEASELIDEYQERAANYLEQLNEVKETVKRDYIKRVDAPDYCEPAPYILATGRRGVILKPEYQNIKGE